jgi:mono/diheme cytochrome c family protein
MKRTGWFFGALCGLLLLAGCNSGGNPNTSQNQNGTTTASDPQTVYMNNCSSCHGGNRQGTMGPSLQKISEKMNKDEILQVLENGKGSMPAQSHIPQDQREKLADWLIGQP